MGRGNGRGGGVGSFTDEQVAMYKECFKLMDIDKDGVINKNDLRAAFDNVGRLMSEDELNQMLGEIGGSCTFDNMLKCFEAKMAGGVNDPDDVILESILCHDEEIIEVVKGVTTVKHLIDAEYFKHILTTFGDKLTQEELDDMFDEFELDDDGFVLTKSVVDLFVAGGMDEKKEEEKKEEKKEAAPAAEAEAPAEGGKKKKKKKKAAK